MIATRIESQVIRRNHLIWKVIDQNCFYSKNLYNYANYIIRQEYINNNKWIKYRELDKMLQASDPYKELMSQPAQCVLQVLDRNWISFFAANKEWNKNPGKFLGKPKLPKYKAKDGRFPWFIKNNCAFIKDSFLHFKVNRLKGITFKTSVTDRLICVRFIPKGNNYIMEIVYEKEIPDLISANNRITAIDLGVNNFVTLTNNIGKQPIIINGKGIKSINQYYNKQKASLQSDLKRRNDKNWSNKLDSITFKRNMRVKNFMHHVSKYIITYCKLNQMDTLICGLNKTWKQECSMNKKSNQTFIYLPYDMLIQQLQYKCQGVGIKFILTEENYTSGTSFLDGEIPCKENYDNKRRIKRGLFQSANQLINSDVNGSLQIMRKVFPDAVSYGIVGCLTPIIINVTKVT